MGVFDVVGIDLPGPSKWFADPGASTGGLFGLDPWSGDSQKSTSEQQFKVNDQTLQALVAEFFTQINQLAPEQRNILLRNAALAINQPGAAGAKAPLSPSTFAPAQASAARAGQALGFDPSQMGPVLDALRSSTLGAQSAGRKQAGQIAGGVTSFVDPDFVASIQQRPITTTAAPGQDPFATGLQLAQIAAALAVFL